jgi:hypothetical protein
MRLRASSTMSSKVRSSSFGDGIMLDSQLPEWGPRD